ncbi:MAG: adenosylmethionine--8-amino-7-oxononanoate transaminase [Nitrospirae bacterium CG02_land_8_20_14_3_00_44_33]|nr:MAG: adenosylmethionine--8-amino-7-oxononanoate transaminase [Nitrospirae bacterium CG02_land_8_20_14_3_00_44_33]PIV67422.1 MAG: adenosylmethionine--8-amino-7-oxononanoate transaminase [Nitrospirae bacterium CG01_land_8_20_14_3_00_44_22]PIW88572.1 MAG: adenosylmethionine--8-amino-7-oxononanoate transaminase [Nitrospirae bacterium CG_4_8_14_3_um_filter_44_28]
MEISDENKHLEDLDKKYIWHPFTQMRDWLEEKPVIISEGRDCFIKDIYGRWYLDGVSSMWVNIHGHRKKEIDEAIKEQIDRISHSTLLGLSNVPAIQLSERLIKLFSQSLVGSQLPNPPIPLLVKGGGGGFKVFYSDNGSTSVEVALKMAFQYWLHKGVTGKNSFLSLENAYHGDTLGAVSVGGIETFHKVFRPLLFKTYNAPSPYCYRCESGLSYPDCKTACLKKMEAILRKHSSEIAAVIIEPLVQAAGGMLVAPAGYLKGVRDLCTKYKALMIADEVATGFGRTGKMFACEHEAVTPDIMCLSKGITGGYLPLAVTIATDEIYNAFLGEFRELKTFFHGHSYTGNPLACAAALACLDIFEKEETLKNLQPKIELLEGWLKEISELPHVGDARNKGLMAGVELVKDKNTKEPYAWEEKMGWKAAYHARDNGVFIRPLGNVMVIMPPLSISIENLGRMLGIIKNAISAVT